MSRDRNVLVVDDEPATLDFLADTIRAMGVTVTSVQDGAAALAAAAQRTPDLVLLDALLPKMDGFQVLAALRKSHPAVPVVMMSGIYRKRSYETEAVDRLGAVEYLCKPIPVLKLWELVERYAPPGSVVAPPVAAPGAHFQATPLPAVVADLERKRDTGLLFVRGSGGTAILFFEDGRLVFGRSNDPQSRLDRVLRATGRLSAEGQARAHEILSVGKGKVRLGELLVAEGLVSEDDVRHALAEQQRQHVLRPFSWTNASSSFVLSDAPRHETFKLSFDTHALVFWGCRALPDESVLNAWLPPGSSLMKLSVDPASVAVRFSLTPAEVELLSLADGTRDLAKLRAMGRMAQVDVPRLVTAFTCLGLAEALPGALQPEAPASGPIRASVAGAGDLERTSAAALLVAIHFSGKTGVLRAQAPGGAQAAKRAIYFDGGRVAFATSTAPEDRLGQVLLRSGLVSTAALSEALASAKDRPGTSLGRLLVDQKALSLDDLHRALVAQVQHVVASLIGWRRGTFRFEEGNPDRPEIVPLSLSTLEAVLVALRGSAFTALAAQRPETDCILRRAPSCFDLAGEFPLSPLEDTVLLAVDRGASTGQVLARLSEAPEQVLRAFHVLASVGLIEVVLTSAEPHADRSYPSIPEMEVFGSVPTEVATDPTGGMGDESSFDGLWDEVMTEAVEGAFEPDADTVTAELRLRSPVPGPAAGALAPSPQAQVAVLERIQTAEGEADAFLEGLAAHVAGHPAAVPEAILALLPARLRGRFGH